MSLLQFPCVLSPPGGDVEDVALVEAGGGARVAAVVHLQAAPLPLHRVAPAALGPLHPADGEGKHSQLGS